MKKILLSVALCAMIPAMSQAENMALKFPEQTSTGTKTATRLTVSETVLGVTRAGESWLNVEKSFTMAAWIKVNAHHSAAGGNALFGHQAQDHVNYNGSFFVASPAGTKSITLVGKTNSGAYSYSEDSQFSTPLDEWTFYAVVYDAEASTKTLTLYINGEQKAVKNLPDYLQLFPDNPGVLYFGTFGSNATYDDAQIYSKALTADEVKTAMENPTAVSDLICYYTFDEVLAGTTGQFENFGSMSDVPALYRTGTGSADGSGVISCGTNHAETAPELVEGRTSVGIDDIAAELEEEDPASVRYYNLQGMEVKAENLGNGLYIRKSNTKVEKVLVK